MDLPAGLGDLKDYAVNLAALVIALPTLLLFISCANFFSLRRPLKESALFPGSVAVLLPVRNEEANIPALVESLRKQMGISDLTFLFIDDGSTDNTFELINEYIKDDARFSIRIGETLLSGWLGKPFALHQGLTATTSEIVVVIDADVRLHADALVSAINLMKSRKLAFASAYPRQIAISWSERLIQPLLQWSWMSTVPLAIAERSSNPAFAVANGQFFIAERSALEAVGGFASVRSEIIDDIALARVFLRQGFKGTVIDGSDIATCRMYASWPELREGYSKSLRVAFGSHIGSIIAVVFLIAVGIAPLTIGVFGYFILISSRLVSALATRARIFDVLLHPLSIALLIYLLGRSWMMRGRTQWKGRLV